MKLTDASAVISGGSSGVGAATARALTSAGATVIVLDRARPDDPLPGCTYLEVDVTDGAAVTAAIATGAESVPPIRVAVSCAGVAPSQRILGRNGPHDFDDFARVVAINLLGTFHVMTAAAAHIAQAEPDEHGQRGVVVNTSSGAAFEGQIGQAAYAASKGGVNALTLPAARDLAQHGIRVLTVAPGLMDTPMVAGFSQQVQDSLAASVPFPQRLCRPEEFAQLVLDLVAHDYMNGEIVRMDGALRMAPR